MSVVVMAAVFKQSASKGTARLVLLALADVASDDGVATAYGRSHTVLAGKANVAKGSVRRAIETLVELGEVELIKLGDGRKSSDYRIRLPGIEGVDPVTPRSVEGVDPVTPGDLLARPQGDDPVTPISPSSSVRDPSSPSATPKPEDEALTITKAFWDYCHENEIPRPTLPSGGKGNPFLALRGIIAGLLAAGWTRAEIKAALVETDLYTTNALTMILNRQRRGTRRPETTSPIVSYKNEGADIDRHD